MAGLGGRFQRLAELVLQPGGALDVVAHLHPVDRRDPGGAGLPGPGRGVGGLRVLGLQPAAGLQQRRAEAVPDPGRERGRAVPALHLRLPGRRASARPRRVTARQPLRRVAEAQLGDGPLHGVQRVAPRGGQEALAAGPLEQLGAQVLQVRAAVQEEHLAGDHRQQLVVVAAEPVAPPGQHRADAADLAVDPVAPEDAPGQGEAAEAAEPVEGSEAAEQEGVRGQVRAHGIVGPAGGRLAEPVLVPAQQPGPLLIGPRPVGPARLGAPQQHHRCRVQHRPAPVRRQRRLQRRGTSSSGRSRRRTCRHRPGGRVVPGQPAQVAGPSSTMASFSAPGARARCRSGAGSTGHRQGPGKPGAAGRGGDGHRAASAPSPPVRAWTRQAWMCCMPRLSLSASSRPDRWIYRSVESV